MFEVLASCKYNKKINCCKFRRRLWFSVLSTGKIDGPLEGSKTQISIKQKRWKNIKRKYKSIIKSSKLKGKKQRRLNTNIENTNNYNLWKS